MREIPLTEFGLEPTASACARKGWAMKTLQNWIKAGLIPVAKVGTGRSAKFLVRVTDVDSFVPPVREDGRGRPLKGATKKPAPKRGRKGKP